VRLFVLLLLHINSLIKRHVTVAVSLLLLLAVAVAAIVVVVAVVMLLSIAPTTKTAAYYSRKHRVYTICLSYSLNTAYF